MKNIFSSLLCIGLSATLHAQVTFQKLYGGSDDEGMFELVRTYDGGYICAGQTESFGAPQNDIYLVKTDAYGVLQWSKVYRGSGTEYAIGISETADHGFIVSGATTSFGSGNEDGFLMKTDQTGNMQWSKAFGGSAEDMLFAAIQTNDGGYIAAGHTSSTGAGSMEILILRIDVNGDTLWTRIMGGTNWENATDIIQTTDSSFVFCGRTGSFGSVYLKIFLGKLSAAGDTLWSVQYGGNGQEESQSLQETMNGDYIVCGSTNSFSSTNYNAYLSRFDTAGNMLWSKIYGGQNTEAVYEVVNMPDSGFAFVGFTETFGPGHRGNDSANVWLVRTDTNGDTLWSKSYGGDYMDEVYGLEHADDGGLTILAYSSSFGNDSLDNYLIMTDSAGFSNCNEEPCYPFVFSPPTAVERVSPQITSGIGVTSALFTPLVPGTFQSTLCFAVGIDEEEISEREILLYPNPAVNQLSVISYQLSEKSVMEIFDVLGQRVFSQLHTSSLKPQTISADVSNLSPGIYLVKVLCGNQTFTRKLVISR